MTILKVEWLLTRKCNIICDYCKIRDNSTLRGKELTLEQVKLGVDYIHKRFPGIIIVFFGGEPTVLEWLPELIRYCEDIGQLYAVISNGIRVMKDEKYFNKLLGAGISNWSVSLDYMDAIFLSGADLGSFSGSELKSHTGFLSLVKMKEAGVKDLVCCIAVTKHNIKQIPLMIKTLSGMGIWSITSPLQIGDDSFEYSSSSATMQELKCMDPIIIREVANRLADMARSGKYLMHNGAEFYEMWEEGFISADWKCTTGKFNLTVDADGSLKRCVEKKAGLGDFNILSLRYHEKEYEEALKQELTCKGCFWDPAVESTLRAKTKNIDSAKKSFLHGR